MGYNHILNNSQAINGISAGQLLTLPSNGSAHLLDDQSAKHSIELILQEEREESLLQVVSRPYGPSNEQGRASYENRNPQLRASGTQTWGFQKVDLDPDRPVTIIAICQNEGSEPISSQDASPAECNVDYPLKNSKAEAQR